MRSNEWIYHKERSFVSNYFTFLKMLFQFKNLLYRFYLLYQQTKGIYTKGLYTFHKRWSFILFYFIFVSNRISQRQKTLSKLERFFLAEKYFKVLISHHLETKCPPRTFFWQKNVFRLWFPTILRPNVLLAPYLLPSQSKILLNLPLIFWIKKVGWMHDSSFFGFGVASEENSSSFFIVVQ